MGSYRSFPPVTPTCAEGCFAYGDLGAVGVDEFLKLAHFQSVGNE